MTTPDPTATLAEGIEALERGIDRLAEAQERTARAVEALALLKATGQAPRWPSRTVLEAQKALVADIVNEANR